MKLQLVMLADDTDAVVMVNSAGKWFVYQNPRPYSPNDPPVILEPVKAEDVVALLAAELTRKD